MSNFNCQPNSNTRLFTESIRPMNGKSVEFYLLASDANGRGTTGDPRE